MATAYAISNSDGVGVNRYPMYKLLNYSICRTILLILQDKTNYLFREEVTASVFSYLVHNDYCCNQRSERISFHRQTNSDKAGFLQYQLVFADKIR